MCHLSLKQCFSAFFLLLLLFCLNTVQATIPGTLNYQAFLTDDNGLPIDGLTNITFRIYDVNAGGIELWSDSRVVDVNQGVFSVELGGAGNPFPISLFEMPLWMGLSIESDAEMLPRRPLSSTGYSFKAQDADTLEGVGAAALDQSAHVGDTGNPHNVTAAQTGAATSADLGTHEGDGSAHHTKTTTFPELTGQIADSQIPSLIARDSEIVPTILNNDGPGSTLNADLLDGLSSEAFMPTGTDLWVNTTGDTMTGGLTVPSFTIDGNTNTIIKSQGDIRIYDDINALRWFDSSGSTQRTSLYVSDSKVYLYDFNTARYILQSDGDGVGIGTSLISPDFDVTVPSLTATQIGIGSGATVYDLDIRGDNSTYLASIINDTSSTGAFGLRNYADAYDAGTATTIAAYISGTAGSTGGAAYGIQTRANAYGTSPAYGVFSSATGGTTSGNEYAFYGIGKGYFTDDLDVNGTAFIGYERIVGISSSLSATISSCGMISSGTCYYGGSSVSCPTGKVAVGGGCNCNSSYNCGLIRNYASSESSWYCNAVASATGYTVTPYVHCARVDN